MDTSERIGKQAEQIKADKEKQIADLEGVIYDTFYNLNPDADARFVLWPEVIKAKKDSDPIQALASVLSLVESGGY